MERKILVINTGSTSTKIAIFHDGAEIFRDDVSHDPGQLQKLETIDDQVRFRKRVIGDSLQKHRINLQGLSAIAARGGTFGSVKGGAYIVDKSLTEACRHPETRHASNLSALIAQEYADEYGCDAYIYDAVCTDEVEPAARMTGIKGVERRVFSHTLNTRAVAIKEAEAMGKKYEECNFIVAHLGGGMSINVHHHGKIVDLVSDDDGAMSPERCGRINAITMARICFSGKYRTENEMIRKLKGGSGLLDYLGVTDMRVIGKMIEDGDEYASEIIQCMAYQAYQVSKDISSLAAVVEGRVDRIILTGGCAYSSYLTEPISRRVSFIAPVSIMPGSMEMEAIARGVERVLDGQEKFRRYSKEH